ncbi:hypothetical protein HanXRQr2_Chr07g0282681 [Helianthus annuus]|uniref:Uncharacterized protein n=1 Tax=Helianthus annuus TaxID=4232 RepID=A0A9K3NEQ7_HELAN|nr:hypothetical protein HanXRQr2_Chr07g0282681 [Helianthus annuus]KAJ0903747.1 hypothetical protein HanPSC8_Chr07g0273491 [Helianthus annuus]
MSYISFPKHLINSAALFVASSISVSNMTLKLYGACEEKKKKKNSKITNFLQYQDYNKVDV